MRLFFGLLFLSLTAQAQFEDFDDILAPSTLTPKVGIICKAQVMFAQTDMVIDVKNGIATQVAGENKYIYAINSFVFEKSDKKDSVRLGLKGELMSVIDLATGKETKTISKSGKFEFNSALPTKDGKKFKAQKFEASTSVKYAGGSSMNFSDAQTNSTECKLVKGGDFVKDLGKNTSVKMAGEYPKKVDNSSRGSKKEVEIKTGKSVPISPARSTKQ